MQAEDKPPRRVLLVDPIHPRAEEWLSERCEVVTPAGSPLRRALAGCDAAIVRTSRVDAEALGDAQRLRVISKHGIGLDNIDVAAATERGIVVTNCPDDNAAAVAEFTLACVLLALRPILPAARWLRDGDVPGGSLVAASEAAGLIGEELATQTVGVVGWGGIGRRVGLAIKALGALVTAYDPGRPRCTTWADGVQTAQDLDELLEVADIVTLHVPLNAGTRGLIGATQLARMRRGSSLINTSRGGVVNEQALATALRAGHLRSAALDVFAAEPPGKGHPLLNMPNVVATPHIAGLTHSSLLRMGMSSARAVVDVLAGRIPDYVVNGELLRIVSDIGNTNT